MTWYIYFYHSSK